MIKWIKNTATSIVVPYVYGCGRCDLCPSKAVGRHGLTGLRLCERCYQQVKLDLGTPRNPEPRS